VLGEALNAARFTQISQPAEARVAEQLRTHIQQERSQALATIAEMLKNANP